MQAPYNVVQYMLAGDPTALIYFIVDSNTGYVSLKQSVALDPNKLLSYSVRICKEFVCNF